MDELFRGMSSSFSEMGSVLTASVIVIVVALYLFRKQWSESIKGVKLNRKKKLINKRRLVKDLWSHDLFITAESVKKKVSAIRFTTHGEYDVVKTKLLKILVENQLNSFTKSMKEFIKRDCIDNFEGQRLKFTLTEVLRHGVERYNKETSEQFIRMGVSKEDADFLIGEYEYFRDEIQEGFIDRIDSITTNDNYNSNYDRLSAVFEVLAMGLYLIPKDSVTACNRINGRFKAYAGKI